MFKEIKKYEENLAIIDIMLGLHDNGGVISQFKDQYNLRYFGEILERHEASGIDKWNIVETIALNSNIHSIDRLDHNGSQYVDFLKLIQKDIEDDFTMEKFLVYYMFLFKLNDLSKIENLINIMELKSNRMNEDFITVCYFIDKYEIPVVDSLRKWVVCKLDEEKINFDLSLFKDKWYSNEYIRRLVGLKKIVKTFGLKAKDFKDGKNRLDEIKTLRFLGSTSPSKVLYGKLFSEDMEMDMFYHLMNLLSQKLYSVGGEGYITCKTLYTSLVFDEIRINKNFNYLMSWYEYGFNTIDLQSIECKDLVFIYEYLYKHKYIEEFFISDSFISFLNENIDTFIDGYLNYALCEIYKGYEYNDNNYEADSTLYSKQYYSFLDNKFSRLLSLIVVGIDNKSKAREIYVEFIEPYLKNNIINSNSDDENLKRILSKLLLSKIVTLNELLFSNNVINKVIELIVIRLIELKVDYVPYLFQCFRDNEDVVNKILNIRLLRFRNHSMGGYGYGYVNESVLSLILHNLSKIIKYSSFENMLDIDKEMYKKMMDYYFYYETVGYTNYIAHNIGNKSFQQLLGLDDNEAKQVIKELINCESVRQRYKSDLKTVAYTKEERICMELDLKIKSLDGERCGVNSYYDVIDGLSKLESKSTRVGYRTKMLQCLRPDNISSYNPDIAYFEVCKELFMKSIITMEDFNVLLSKVSLYLDNRKKMKNN